jgi:plasmid stabilization system protein ParE
MDNYQEREGRPLSYQVRCTAEARADLICLYPFLLEQNPLAAGQALETIRKGEDMLESFPFTCRKVDPDNPYLRELVVPFSNTGCVSLFEIEGEGTVTILAIRHQREDDYY